MGASFNMIFLRINQLIVRDIDYYQIGFCGFCKCIFNDLIKNLFVIIFIIANLVGDMVELPNHNLRVLQTLNHEGLQQTVYEFG